MRYFARLAYNGARYHGWQKQFGQISVQQIIEEKISLLLRNPTEVLGCGRTDTGVHAMDYVLHFDTNDQVNPDFLFRLNKILPEDIVFYKLEIVSDQAHARFDAISRSYEYRITQHKSPFQLETVWHYPYFAQTNWDLVQKAASLIKEYDHFYTFCKSNTDVATMRCDIRRSEWMVEGETASYHIESDRFLRGMIRLIVGMCLKVGRGKLTLDTVKLALDNQDRLLLAESAPPKGLFLKNIQYEYF